MTLIDTGENTLTGGRLKRVREHLTGGTFCFTYGDGVSDVNIRALVDFHREQKALATLTATQPPGRFGALTLGSAQTHVSGFHEKPGGDGAWINGGFFVVEPEALDSIEGDGYSVGARTAPAAGTGGCCWRRTSTGGSGNRWTRCATRCISRISGAPDRHPGRCGSADLPR